MKSHSFKDLKWSVVGGDLKVTERFYFKKDVDELVKRLEMQVKVLAETVVKPPMNHPDSTVKVENWSVREAKRRLND